MNQDMEKLAKKTLNEGIAFFKKGLQRDAIQRFLLVINLYPESDVADNAHYNLGQVYMKQGSLTRAYSQFKMIMDYYPKSDAAFFAEDMMQECKHQADPSADLYQQAERAYAEQKFQDARQLFEKLVTESPNSDLADNAHFALGMLGRRLQDQALEAKHFEIVRTQYPDSDAAAVLANL